MSQLYLKGVYYDAGDAGGLWFKNDSGSYEEVSAGGVTIYTGDGSLSGDRSIDLDGHDLNIETSENYFFLLQPSIFRAQMQAIGDGGNYSLIDARGSTDDGVYWNFECFDGTHQVTLKGDAQAETVTITGAANGVVLEDLAGGGTTGLSIDNDGKIIRTP